MSRIKISIPEKFPFTCAITVRVNDINYGGHLGNDSILSIIHEARMQFLTHYGYTEMNLENVNLIMADVAIEFKAEAFWGDTLIVSVAATDFQKAGFDLYYLLENKKEGIATTVAKAKTGMVCFDYANRKIVAVPQEVVTNLQS